MYERGDADELATATHIPENEFRNVNFPVVLTNLTSMRIIGKRSFENARNQGNKVDLSQSKQLQSVEDSAFFSFHGALRVVGPYKELVKIGQRAFQRFKGNGEIDLSNSPALRYVGTYAFEHKPFHPNTDPPNKLKLTFVGKFPSLVSVQHATFWNHDDWDSHVEIQCRGPSMSNMFQRTDNFKEFYGHVNRHGENCACQDACGQSATGKKSPECNFPPGGGAVPLTKMMLVRNNQDEFAAATCVPAKEFLNFEPKITLKGLTNMINIGSESFRGAGHVNNTVDLSQSTDLEILGGRAFQDFSGDVRIKGPYARLQKVSDYLFGGAGNKPGHKLLDISNSPRLASIGNNVASGTGSKVQVVLVGRFPLLTQIGDGCFRDSANNINHIEIRCRSPSGLKVGGYNGLYSFRGTKTLIRGGEKCSCDDDCAVTKYLQCYKGGKDHIEGAGEDTETKTVMCKAAVARLNQLDNVAAVRKDAFRCNAVFIRMTGDDTATYSKIVDALNLYVPAFEMRKESPKYPAVKDDARDGNGPICDAAIGKLNR
eukprot:gene26456-10959_t